MTSEVCSIEPHHIVSILDSHTYILRCEHKAFGMITYNLHDQVCYITLMMENTNAGFKIDARGVWKLYQEDGLFDVDQVLKAMEDTDGNNW